MTSADQGAQFLIIGASGFVGQRVLAGLGSERAVGTYFSRPFSGGHRFNLATDSIEALLDALPAKFTHALVFGAFTKIDECARDPVGTAKTNVEGVIRTIDGLMSRGIVPIFASSDAVYDGSRGHWTETDVVRPITEYGRQKVAVERHLQSRKQPWLVVRICKVLDPELSSSGILGPWITDFFQRTLIRCATDQTFTPVGVDDVVTACVALAEGRATGLFNLGGGESVTRFELLCHLVNSVREIADIEPVIETCSLRSLDLVEPRPLDASVSIAKLQAAIPFRPESLVSLCRRAAAQYKRLNNLR